MRRVVVAARCPAACLCFAGPAAARGLGAGRGAAAVTSLDATAVPRLPGGVKLRFDAVRGKHVLLAPERAFGLDEAAVAVVELVDGKRSVREIVDALAEKYAEDRAVIAADVGAMLGDLAAKRVIEL